MTQKMSEWLLRGAQKDEQSITADWEAVGRTLIDGVHVREGRCVAKRNGSVTELYRDDWFAGPDGVGQVFVVRLAVAGVSAWHAHATTIDRLAVTAGAAALVLYDARCDSPTFGCVNEFLLHQRRPTVVVIRPVSGTVSRTRATSRACSSTCLTARINTAIPTTGGSRWIPAKSRTRSRQVDRERSERHRPPSPGSTAIGVLIGAGRFARNTPSR